MCEISCVCRSYPPEGIVVETTEINLLGSFFYSDCSVGNPENNSAKGKMEQVPVLNKLSRIPVMGIFMGIARIALAIIHSLGHLFIFCVRPTKGHLFHAAKGACELLRGIIEAMPLIGRIFASIYNPTGCGRAKLDADHESGRTWWILKIYNPRKPDPVDRWMVNWYPRKDDHGRPIRYTRGGTSYIKA